MAMQDRIEARLREVFVFNAGMAFLLVASLYPVLMT
jgi:hypothetical protein